MRPTERTFLKGHSSDNVEFIGLLHTRKKRVQQLQCFLCAGLLAIFIMILVGSVSYSVNHSKTVTNETDSMNTETISTSRPNLLLAMPNNSARYNSTFFEREEIDEALLAGNEAMQERYNADATTKELPFPSPYSRHQFSVSTSVYAGKLAMAAVGEIAATRKIERRRTRKGEESAIGRFFDPGWVPNGGCKEYSELKCEKSKYRTIDGTCNHPKHYGATFTPFRRVLYPDYSDGINTPRSGKFGKQLPSAREVSLKIHKPAPSSNPSFTVMLAVFGQFLDHDITGTALSQGINGKSLSCCPPTHTHPECFPVYVGRGDPVYDMTGNTCMEFVRSAPAPQCRIGPREQLNQVTAFIDASTMYGVTRRNVRELRQGVDGLLRTFITHDNRTLLPLSKNIYDGCNRKLEMKRGRYCFATGDDRANENLHLTTMHLIWLRQHNFVAGKLKDLNPQWDDEQLFQETRRIIVAQLQHISYREFVPVVLGKNATDSKNLRPLEEGFKERSDPDANPAISNHFSAAAFRFAHTLLPGLMRMTDEMKDTESWVELHRMLFNPYKLYAEDGVKNIVKSATSNVIQKTSTHVTSQLTAHLFEDPTEEKKLPCGLDLVSLNIQRGRDHGLPGYTRWRKHCGLSMPTKFSDLKNDLDSESLQEIAKIFNDVDDIDLYTGALAEVIKSDGLVGPTFTCLLSDQFFRLQQGDRFWYEFEGESGSFTEEQLDELRKTSMAKIICDNSVNLQSIQPEVMKSLNNDNPMLSCDDISGPSFYPWKDRKCPKWVSKLLRMIHELASPKPVPIPRR